MSKPKGTKTKAKYGIKKQPLLYVKPEPEARALRDPITANSIIYSNEEAVFLNAMEHYRRSNSRPFPTCGEVLAVIKSLGYRKVETPGTPPRFKRNGG